HFRIHTRSLFSQAAPGSGMAEKQEPCALSIFCARSDYTMTSLEEPPESAGTYVRNRTIHEKTDLPLQRHSGRLQPARQTIRRSGTARLLHAEPCERRHVRIWPQDLSADGPALARCPKRLVCF